jgi:hypothetical protein
MAVWWKPHHFYAAFGAWYRKNCAVARDAPDTVFAGYPVPGIRPDICLDKYIFGKIKKLVFKKA